MTLEEVLALLPVKQPAPPLDLGDEPMSVQEYVLASLRKAQEPA